MHTYSFEKLETWQKGKVISERHLRFNKTVP